MLCSLETFDYTKALGRPSLASGGGVHWAIPNGSFHSRREAQAHTTVRLEAQRTITLISQGSYQVLPIAPGQENRSPVTAVILLANNLDGLFQEARVFHWLTQSWPATIVGFALADEFAPTLAELMFGLAVFALRAGLAVSAGSFRRAISPALGGTLAS